MFSFLSNSYTFGSYFSPPPGANLGGGRPPVLGAQTVLEAAPNPTEVGAFGARGLVGLGVLPQEAEDG